MVSIELVRRRYIIFLIVSFAFVLSFFHRMSLAAVASGLMAERGLTPGQIGTLGSVYFYVYSLIQPPIGLIVDRWGVRRLLAGTMLIATAGGLIFAFGQSFGWLLFGRILIGLGYSAVFISGVKLVTELFPPSDMALWVGLFQAVSSFGTILAGRPLVEASQWLGWSGGFLIAALFTALTAGAVWISLRGERGRCPPAASRTARSDQLPLRSPLLYAFGMMMFMFVGVHISFQSVWSGPYLADVYRFRPAEVGNLLMLMPIGQIIGFAAVGWAADRLFRSREITAILCSWLYTGLWILLALAPAGLSAGGIVALYLALGALSSWFVLTVSLVRARLPGDNVGSAIGIVNLMAMLGGAVLQQGFGALLNRFPISHGAIPLAGYQTTFQVAAIVAVVGSLLLLAGIRIRPVTAASKPAP